MLLLPTEHDTDKDDAPMGDTYIRLNDALPEHRKIVAAGGDAAWLHICGLAYCSRNLSDGRVPKGLVPRLSDRKQPMKLAAKLTEVNLWHAVGHDCKRCPQPDPDEFVIHDYLQHQRSAEHVEAIKKKRAEAGRAGGQQKAANAAHSAEAEDKQGSSNLLDGCYDSAVADATPEAVTEADTEVVTPSACADAQREDADETPGAELVLIRVEDKKPKRTRRKKADRTIEDDLADGLTNGYWDRYSKTTAVNWIAVRQIVLTALKNGNERNDIAFGLDLLGREGKPVTGNTLTFAITHVRAQRTQSASPGAVDRRQQATNDLFERAMQRAIAKEEAS